jgi:hypothetical protein
MLMNAADYRESLRRYSPRVFVNGRGIDGSPTCRAHLGPRLSRARSTARESACIGGDM